MAERSRFWRELFCAYFPTRFFQSHRYRISIIKIAVYFNLSCIFEGRYFFFIINFFNLVLSHNAVSAAKVPGTRM